MKTKDGFIQGYNAQAAVDAEAQVIVAHGLDANGSDQHQLTPMVDAVEANMGRKPEQVSADAGYCSDANLAAMEERAIDAYIAAGRAKHPTDGEGGSKRVADMREKIKAGGHDDPVSPAQAIARAGVRADQAGPRLPSVPDARARQGRPRMGPRLPRPQHAQARPRAESVRRRPRHRLNLENPPKTGQIHQFRAQTRSYPSLRRRAGYYLDRLLAKALCLGSHRRTLIATCDQRLLGWRRHLVVQHADDPRFAGNVAKSFSLELGGEFPASSAHTGGGSSRQSHSVGSLSRESAAVELAFVLAPASGEYPRRRPSASDPSAERAQSKIVTL